MWDVSVVVTRDREYHLTLRVQHESACHTTIYAKNRQDCVAWRIFECTKFLFGVFLLKAVTWKTRASHGWNLVCLGVTAIAWMTQSAQALLLEGPGQKRVSWFSAFFVSGPSLGHNLGHWWGLEVSGWLAGLRVQRGHSCPRWAES